MAGRPLGFRSLVQALSRYSHAQLEKLIAAIPTEDNRVAKLKAKREKLSRSMAKLDRQIAKLSGGAVSVAAPARRGRKPGRRKGYTLSAETRRKMSEAAKRRYARRGTSAAAPSKPKRTVSPEARAKMAAAAKARWAKVKGSAQPT